VRVELRRAGLFWRVARDGRRVWLGRGLSRALIALAHALAHAIITETLPRDDSQP
jgi:hypothetical protein